MRKHTRGSSPSPFAAFDRTMQGIANEAKPDVNAVVKIGMPVNQNSGTADSKAAADSALVGKGEALADVFIARIKDQSGALKSFLKDLAELDQQGRKGFRVAITKHKKQVRAYVESKKGTDEYEMYSRTASSAMVRLSEAVTFSKAVDMGMSVTDELLRQQTYHSLIAMARLYKSAKASDGVDVSGPTKRKQVSVLERAKAYLLKICKTPEDFEQVAELAETLAAVKG